MDCFCAMVLSDVLADLLLPPPSLPFAPLRRAGVFGKVGGRGGGNGADDSRREDGRLVFRCQPSTLNFASGSDGWSTSVVCQ